MTPTRFLSLAPRTLPALLALASLQALAAAPTGLLNDTGMTQCYDGSGLAACTAANAGDTAPYARQDGRFGRDAAAANGLLTKAGGGAAGFDFTALDASGNPIPLVGGVPTATPVCVRDNLTKLVWEVKTAANMYDTYTLDNWAGYRDSLVNGGGLCGLAGGWRLPSRRELFSIVHHGASNPAIDTNFFPNTTNNWYWTSDAVGDSSVDWWMILFGDGYANSDLAFHDHHIRLVNSDGPSPGPAYTNHGDGTVTDATTGLMWDRCAYGQTGNCQDGAGTYTWAQAMALAPAVNALNGGAGYKGYNDWRLPNVNELESLVNVDATWPAIDQSVFPNARDAYWASTVYHPNTALNWYVEFYKGLKWHNWRSDEFHRVRLVRGGQPYAATDLLPDITPPLLSGLAVSRVWPTDVTLDATGNETATGYWIAVPRDAAAPTAAQVKAGAGYASVTVAGHGSGPMAAGVAAHFPIAGLALWTAYDLYLVAEDGAGNLSEPGKTQFATVPILNLSATASPPAGGTAACTPGSVDHGGNGACAHTANVGYTFADWSGDCSGASCTFSNVTEDKNVTANFTLNQYAVTTAANPAAGGSVTCSPNPVSHGSGSTCTATPSSGYAFADWSGDCNGTACTLGNVTGTHGVNANFTLIPYAVTALVNPAAGGSAACMPAVVHYDEGSACTATPNPGYAFVGWRGACAGQGTACGLGAIRSDQASTADFTPLFAAGPLNDTGQTQCFDGAQLTACTAANAGDAAPQPRQDARFGRDAQARLGQLAKTGAGVAGFDFTALDADGNAVAPGDHVCVRDNATGLIWSAQSFEAQWAEATSAGPARCGLGIGWRLPSRRELLSLVDNGAHHPAIDGAYFPGTVSGPYWSGDAYGLDTAKAWHVDFQDGAPDTDAKTASHAVRLVANDINRAPSFTQGADQTVLEDAGPQTVVGWASGITSGNVTSQALHFIVGNDNPALFSVPPTVAADGTLTYTPAPDANGRANVTVRLADDGGIANGGVDVSTPRDFVIDVTPVNDPPSLTLGSDIVLPKTWRPGPISLPGWATVSAGPANESGQHLTATLRLLDVTGQKAMAFEAAPTLDPSTGTLSFTIEHTLVEGPMANSTSTLLSWFSAAGLARVEVELKDDGGSANGGADTAATGTFTIFLDPVPTAVDVTIRYPWRSPCVPLTVTAWDADTDFNLPADFSIVDDPYPWPVVQFTSLPQSGFLTDFISRSARAEDMPQQTGQRAEALDATSAYKELSPAPTAAHVAAGYNFYGTTCYVPFGSTFTGFDSATFVVIDKDGHVSGTGTVSIEIFED